MIGATALAFPLGVLEGDIRGLMGLSLGVSALNASEPSDELVLALVFDVKKFQKYVPNPDSNLYQDNLFRI